MAAYTHAPWLAGGDAGSLQCFDAKPPTPTTPSHSSNHSVRSSRSLRLPAHTLTIHEFRKQQSTTAPPRIEAPPPPGKRLRRKAAASALNELERAPLVARKVPTDASPYFRPLPPSPSTPPTTTQPLLSQESVIQPPQSEDRSFRSLLARSRIQSNSSSSIVVKPLRSRVVLPTIDTDLPAQLESSYRVLQPAFRSRASLSADEHRSNDVHSSTTPSSFSLSRFPRPPQFVDPSLSPPPDDKDIPPGNTFRFTTTAPVTPPATPAVIHYRGASFDLLNPHSSLPNHDIVDPSRDFGSSEYLLLRTEDESSPQMVLKTKRPLYGDLGAAHAGIMRRAGDSDFGSSNPDLAYPPPVAMSPESSDAYTPESNMAPSPLHVRKPTNDSRFSFRGLTRTLTKKLGRSTEETNNEAFDLKEFTEPILRATSSGRDDHSPYVSVPDLSYFQDTAVSPVARCNTEFTHDAGLVQHHTHTNTVIDNAVLEDQDEPINKHCTEPLASMVPDDTSTDVPQTEVPRALSIGNEESTKLYYDDNVSVYASSSIYTADNRRQSRYDPSLASKHQSNAFGFGDMNASQQTHEYTDVSLARNSHRASGPYFRQARRSTAQGTGKTDTITKFIDRYDPDATENTSSLQDGQTTHTSGFVDPFSDEAGNPFDDEEDEDDEENFLPLYTSRNFPSQVPGRGGSEPIIRHSQNGVCIQTTGARKYPSVWGSGPPPTKPAPLPPAVSAPLPPPFEYDELPYLHKPAPSELYSKPSDYSYAYGDTKNLLNISESDEAVNSSLPPGALQPSSSYSQPEARPVEPSSSYSQESGGFQYSTYAVDRTGQPLGDVATKKADIPAMWTRRGSADMSRNFRRSRRSSAGPTAQDKDEWETVADESPRRRVSLDSIANYSSSEEDELVGSKMPEWGSSKHSEFLNYIHGKSKRCHENPFVALPPHMITTERTGAAPEIYSPTELPSPLVSTTTPAFNYRSPPLVNSIDEPLDTAWSSPYTRKETKELLASGPNDSILRGSQASSSQVKSPESVASTHGTTPETNWLLATYGSKGKIRAERRLSASIIHERELTLRKLSSGFSGSDFHTAKSSEPDNTSPASPISPVSPVSPTVGLSIRKSRQRGRGEYKNFYATPYAATGSVTRIKPGSAYPKTLPESPSEESLSPRVNGIKPVHPSSPLSGQGRRVALGNSTKFCRASQPQSDRPAVVKQTKLRQMRLASTPSRPQSTTSTQHTANTTMSRFLPVRPSTANTTTPLCTADPSLATFPGCQAGTDTSAPKLRYPAREAQLEDEKRRIMLSWMIFAFFCAFPPCMFLYRTFGDSIIATLTDGHLGHCTRQSKRIALIAGIFVNLGLVTIILVPLLVKAASR